MRGTWECKRIGNGNYMQAKCELAGGLPEPHECTLGASEHVGGIQTFVGGRVRA